MPDAPKQVETDTQAIIDGWTELASTATFTGMTLAEYTATVQPSFDARKKVAQLEIDLKAAQDARDKADVTTTQTNADVVKAVVADKNYGDDSALYEKMGYVRKSTRASGLTRKSKTATQPPNNNRNQAVSQEQQCRTVEERSGICLFEAENKEV